MFIGVVTSVIWIVVILLVTQDMSAAQAASLPNIEVMYQATGSKSVATFLQSYMTLLYYTCMPSQWITCSRIVWAFSRDNGLPLSNYWKHVSTTFNIPVRTTLLSAGFCALYGLVYIASSEAFTSIINTTILMLNITFVVPQGIVLTRGRHHLPKRPFRLGKFGYAVNAFSVIWVTVSGIFLCFPVTNPTTLASMNYNSVVIVGMLLPQEFKASFAMEGSRSTRQSLNHRASQQTIISLLELDPSPIESPTPSDAKQLHDAADTDDSDTLLADSSPGSTTRGPGGGRSTIFYRSHVPRAKPADTYCAQVSRIQRYSSYAMSVFTSLHLANVSLIPAVERSVPASETYLLMTREIYQTTLTEPLLVALPVLAHVGAGIGLRLLRRRENMRRYGGATPAMYALHRSQTGAAALSLWPTLSYISASGYALTVFYAAHVFMNRVLPLVVEGDSANIGLAYVAHGFARHPVVARVAYLGLLATGMGHMVWGMAKWWGHAPSTRGWRSAAVVVDSRTKRKRRNKWLSVHGAALLAMAAWAAGGLTVVARGGLQDGWVGKAYDDMFARVGL
ncbi:choline transport protein, putative [Cordyceps militaris CM01]|uniref:Choline transport protein, putative n=1 Tax=Cordyceps militaris (strain CM01) TaxID=983644 RepID=G3JRI9_CORMM|nr:choline transport protein, putative [Cordyceps militaris CM01]EGX88592.1 choline transport protein, putative [Cordyceps militaris CM01]